MDYLAEKLETLPQTVEAIILTQQDKVKSMAKKYRDAGIFFFLGRGINTATAYEGRLKLMEIALCRLCVSRPAKASMDPVSLIVLGFPVVFICPHDGQTIKTSRNILEMKAPRRKIHLASSREATKK
jgi:glucosamine--fructose-6-phosphate aminotransferase (isomerizing)